MNEFQKKNRCDSKYIPSSKLHIFQSQDGLDTSIETILKRNSFSQLQLTLQLALHIYLQSKA